MNPQLKINSLELK